MYEPRFTITSELTNWIAQIEAIKQKIDRSSILPEQEIALKHRAAIESVHSSTSIEGNPLNERQVEAALAGKMTAWEKKVIEVVNYKKAWDWVLKKSKSSATINIRDILRLHTLVADQLLFENKVGKFRPGPVYIVDIIQNKEVVKYTGPDVEQIKNLLEDLLHWLDKEKFTLHPVLIAGILHYEFVSIHPFSDGNGRVTRLLVKLLLHVLNYDFRDCLVLDTYYWQNTSLYYQALNQAKTYRTQRKADLTNWLTYFTQGFYLVAKELDRKINLISLNKPQQAGRLTDQEIEVLDFVHQFGQVDTQDVIDILQIPERTAQRRLKNLVDQGFLQSAGNGKNTYYILKQK